MEDISLETCEDFSGRLGKIVHGGFISMAVAMGVDSGLFKVMCKMDGTKTSQEIAVIGDLKER